MNVISKTMRPAADEAGESSKALADRHRLPTLYRLIEGEKSAGRRAEILDVRDSNASQHLALPRRDRLASGHRNGRTVRYRIESEPARAVDATLDRSFCAPLFSAKMSAGTETLSA